MIRPSILSTATWLAAGAMTETNRPAEWLPVMQVMINRAVTRKKSVYQVLREPWQFSAFNALKSIPMADEAKVLAEVVRHLGHGAEAMIEKARDTALDMIDRQPDRAVLPLTVTNYWSPRSMVPAGALPRGWNWKILRCFTYPGVPGWRFVFAETVPSGSPGSGNQAKFEMAPA